MKAVLLGAGNLATSLAPALVRAGVEITQVFSRTQESAQRLALWLNSMQENEISTITDIDEVKTNADLYIYVLRDDVIQEVARRVLSFQKTQDAVHIHTSGSLSLGVFFNYPYARNSACIYPFQTFSKERIVDMRNVPLFIEASERQLMRNVIRPLAELLSSQVYEINSDTREYLHIAGVFANNFSNAMYAIAAEQLKKANLPFSVLLPLIEQTADKIRQLPPHEAQTGPARRGDMKTIEWHLSRLEGEEKEIYRLLTDYIISHNPDANN